ncbi:Est3 [Kluyveromyces lactis]|nr:Est3 [Kluyveromyces lactis]
MPNVVLSSRLTNNDSVFLQEWIKPSVRPYYLKNEKTRFWPEQRELVTDLLEYDIIESTFQTALNPGPQRFVRIVKFHKVNDYTVYATIRDSTALILCYFTVDCVLDYETINNDRITLNTLNTLFVIGNVTLQFWNHRECKLWFNQDFPGLRMVPVLKIEKARMFDRDQISSNVQFEWVYNKLHS